MKIYTKNGDKGKTSLWGGQRVDKDDARIHAYGTVDELNSHVGLLLSSCHNTQIHNQLIAIQNHLFSLGSELATPKSTKDEQHPHFFSIKAAAISINDLELWIDEMDDVLQPLQNFILPSGSTSIAYAHVCRTVCRRAERLLLPLLREDMIDESLLQYLNRLSDYLFVLARYMAHVEGVDEVKWNPKS